jgi:cysteine desulfurase/selenocysteine lyase
MQDYYTEYNACGGRVKYAWGQKVDEAVEKTRHDVLNLLKLPAKKYSVSFTTNTTYGINLLLQQIRPGTYSKIITSDIEHNSVFLSTITAAKKLGIERQVVDRDEDGALPYKNDDLSGALVVVNAVSNIDGRKLQNIESLVKDVHNAGGAVIIDAAQTMAHSYAMLQKVEADAICFSAHKMYGPSLGVIVARNEFIKSLDIQIVGGGMVHGVTKDDYELLPDDLSSRFEPGLQAFGEIIGFGAALEWLQSVRPFGMQPSEYIQQLSEELYNGLKEIATVTILNKQASPVITIHTDAFDAHRLAIFLSGANIMARSGTFCCHYYLLSKKQLPPLLRFSLGLHNTKEDVQKVISTMQNLVGKGA